MTEARWPDVKRALDRVLDHDPADWPAVVEAECAGDLDLRREVESLLRQASCIEGFLERPAACVTEIMTVILQQMQNEPAPVGEQFGPWRVEEEIGRGGMGVVYRGARADGHYEQAVAVKVLGLGADTAGAVRRFSLERQVLAGLDHPGIAHLLDGGVSPEGRPFLVMEFVEGKPLDAYCDDHALGVEDRLRLFLQVCDAVAYAHRHLVVHRDLKPSNIFVAEDDGHARVKLLDFGIARLLEAPGGDGAPAQTALTQPTQRPYTPAYAAPEQVEGRALTTATDVWGLGVVLFELLAGQRPFLFDPASPRAIEQKILEEAAPRPSTVAPEERRRRLAGDLDAVVAKALRKEPEARYATAAALATDLQRHLDGLPVEARRGATGYRVRKFVGRHRIGVGIAAVAVVSLIGAAGAFAAQAARLSNALTRAEEVSAFLVGMFEESNVYTGGDPDTPARDLLAAGLARADALDGHPEAQAEVLIAIGKAYSQLGLHDEARPPLDRGLALLESRYGPHHLAVADAQSARADLGVEENDAPLADSLFEAALDTYRAFLGPDDVRVLHAQNGLGKTYLRLARHAEIESLLRAVVHGPRPSGNALPEVAMSLNLYALALKNLGQLDEAVPYMEEALAIYRRELGPDNPLTLTALSNLAGMYKRQGRMEEAERCYREAIAGQRRVLDDDHLVVINEVNDFAVFLRNQGRYAEAERLFRENVARGRRRPEPHPEGLGIPLAGLGKHLLRMGELDEAEALFHEAQAVFAQTVAPDHPFVARPLAGLGNVHLARGEPAQAERFFREALVVLAAAFQEGHEQRAVVESALGEALTAQGRYAEAETLLLGALPSLEAVRHEDVARTRERLAALYDAWGRPEDAARYREPATPSTSGA
jgi:serine/threonine-protein kinase